MRPDVLEKVARRLEALVAVGVDAALVRLLAGVRAQVGLEAVAGGEALLALRVRALVGPLARVSPLVNLDRGEGKFWSEKIIPVVRRVVGPEPTTYDSGENQPRTFQEYFSSERMSKNLSHFFAQK